MWRVICWIVGHDRLTTDVAHGVCLRCGLRVKRPDNSPIPGWKELSRAARRQSVL